MKVDTRYILLSGIGVIILVSVMLIQTPMVNDQNMTLGEPASSVRIGSLIPNDVTVEGTIIDSYVDVLYLMQLQCQLGWS